MRQRTPSEIKAYGDGYAEAYKQFQYLIEKHEISTAVRKMKIFADAVALTVETATDTADTPQTEDYDFRDEQEYNDRWGTDCPFKDVPCSCGEQDECEWHTELDTPQTDCDKCIWNVCNYNKVDWNADTPQTDWYCYITEDRDTQVLDAWQTDCGWGEPNE